MITGVFGSLALVSVLLRLYTRLPPLKAAFCWDDILILAAIVCLRNPNYEQLNLTSDANNSRSL